MGAGKNNINLTVYMASVTFFFIITFQLLSLSLKWGIMNLNHISIISTKMHRTKVNFSIFQKLKLKTDRFLKFNKIKF